VAERSKPTTGSATPGQRLAAIEARQSRLLDELDRLDRRLEEALQTYGGGKAAA